MSLAEPRLTLSGHVPNRQAASRWSPVDAEREYPNPSRRRIPLTLTPVKTGTDSLRSLASLALENGPTPAPDGVVVAYRGKADSVELSIMEDRFPPVESLAHDNGVWYGSIPVDEDGSVEYRLVITTGEKKKTILDPANPEVATNPFGRNSIASGPTYQSPFWLEAKTDQRGSIEPFKLTSKVWERQQQHLIYLPPQYDPDQEASLLLMHDGPEYVEYADLSHCLDVLMADGELPPMIVLLHQPGRRNQEYADSERHLHHVYDELLPALRARHPIGRLFAGGASLGGVASLSLAFRRPGTFDGLILQSASIVTSLGGPFQRGSVFRPVIPLIDEVMDDPGRLPSSLVMSCGTYDGLVEDHRLRVPALEAAVPDFQYTEINAGHHWRCWRDRLAPDLKAALTTGT